VLERLQDQLQRGEIDPELQRDLNLTPERLQQFTQKLEQRLAETADEDTSPDAQARRRQFEETLRTIDFDSTGTTREGGDGPREASGGFSGPTRQAPPELRDAARQYRERMLRRQSSSR
jgi:collagen type III alpha